MASAVGHDRIVQTVFLVIIDTETGLNRQAVDRLPTELAKYSGATVVEADVVARREVVEHRRVICQRACKQPSACGWTLHLNTLRPDFLMIRKGANEEIETVTAFGIAKLLRILFLLRRVVGFCGDRQPSKIAVICRHPVPITPRGYRSQRTLADVPFNLDRCAAQLIAGVEIGINVSQAIKGVRAHDLVILCSGQGGILARNRSLRWPCSHVNLCAAFGILQTEVAR